MCVIPFAPPFERGAQAVLMSELPISVACILFICFICHTYSVKICGTFDSEEFVSSATTELDFRTI